MADKFISMRFKVDEYKALQYLKFRYIQLLMYPFKDVDIIKILLREKYENMLKNEKDEEIGGAIV